MSSNTHSIFRQGVSNAKRVFLLNLALCIVLGVALIAMRLNRPPASDVTPSNDKVPASLEPISALEFANLNGQAHGLSEDPRATYPEKPKRLAKAARKIIEQMRLDDTTISESDQALIATYINGYHSRFDDYYTEQAGYDRGHSLGLKTDPTKYSQLPDQTIVGNLNRERFDAPDQYPQDDAQWLIFKIGYLKGYDAGYLRTKDGVTLKVLYGLEF